MKWRMRWPLPEVTNVGDKILVCSGTQLCLQHNGQAVFLEPEQAKQLADAIMERLEEDA